MSRELVQKQFGASAAQYVTSKVHAEGESLQRLVALTNPLTTWRVLDVATGAGHTALAFAPHVAQVIASDITPQMLAKTAELAQKRGLYNLATQYADAEALPFTAAAFDLVTCRIAPHHFPDVARFVAAAARVLKPGGLLAVVDNIVPEGDVGDYVNSFEKQRDPSHGRCLSLPEWLSCFTAAAFTVSHTEILDKTIAFESWARRMVQDEAVLQQLRFMLEATQAQAFLKPSVAGHDLLFHLQEAVIIGRR